MPKHTATWKSAEKAAAKILGGTRIAGARGVKMQDVEHSVFSVEVKHGKSSIPAFVTKAYKQAVTNAPEGKIPLVVLHNHGSSEYMAVLPLRALAGLMAGALDELAEVVISSSVTEVTDFNSMGGVDGNSHRQCDEA